MIRYHVTCAECEWFYDVPGAQDPKETVKICRIHVNKAHAGDPTVEFFYEPKGEVDSPSPEEKA